MVHSDMKPDSDRKLREGRTPSSADTRECDKCHTRLWKDEEKFGWNRDQNKIIFLKKEVKMMHEARKKKTRKQGKLK
jgi:hypothetical protein